MAEFEPHSRNEWLLNEIRKNTAGEGGNPNRVQTISGTVGNPWGDVSYSELAAAVNQHNATALLTFSYDGPAVTRELYPYYEPGSMLAYGDSLINNNVYGSIFVSWDTDGALSAVMYVGSISGGNILDLTSNFANTEATLTIIWHPLPEGG